MDLCPLMTSWLSCASPLILVGASAFTYGGWTLSLRTRFPGMRGHMSAIQRSLLLRMAGRRRPHGESLPRVAI
ncbi:unnamed protein product [Rhodiola kirilowii]